MTEEERQSTRFILSIEDHQDGFCIRLYENNPINDVEPITLVSDRNWSTIKAIFSSRLCCIDNNYFKCISVSHRLGNEKIEYVCIKEVYTNE